MTPETRSLRDRILAGAPTTTPPGDPHELGRRSLLALAHDMGFAPRVLPCLICGSALEPITPGDWQPCATIFRASGNYGSGVFDPDDGTFLAVNVCDGCLAKAGEDGRVELLTYPRRPRPEPQRELWTADEGWDED